MRMELLHGSLGKTKPNVFVLFYVLCSKRLKTLNAPIIKIQNRQNTCIIKNAYCYWVEKRKTICSRLHSHNNCLVIKSNNAYYYTPISLSFFFLLSHLADVIISINEWNNRNSSYQSIWINVNVSGVRDKVQNVKVLSLKQYWRRNIAEIYMQRIWKGVSEKESPKEERDEFHSQKAI